MDSDSSSESDAPQSVSSGDHERSSPSPGRSSDQQASDHDRSSSSGRVSDQQTSEDGGPEVQPPEPPARKKSSGHYKRHILDPTLKVPKTSRWRLRKRQKLEQQEERFEAQDEMEHQEDQRPSPLPDGEAQDEMEHQEDQRPSPLPDGEGDEARSAPSDASQVDGGSPASAQAPSLPDEPQQADSDVDEPPWDPRGDTSDTENPSSESDESEPEVFSENNFDKCIEKLNEPLHRFTTFTLGKAVLGLLDIFRKHKISKTCLLAIIQLICLMLPQSHSMPKSLYQFFKLVFSISPQKGGYVRHVLCANVSCHKYFGVDHGSTPCSCLQPCVIPIECETCETTEKSYFLECPVDNTITHMFEKRGLGDLIDKNVHEPEPQSHKDIRDGSLYKLLARTKYDITLLSNIDGVPVAHSSKASIWSILSTICEIPAQLRSKFMLFSGLWFGHYKPKMNSYLKPFVDRLVNLGTTGVHWIHPRNGAQYISKVYAIFFSVDAQARAPIQNMHTHGGDCGCGRCEQPGVMVPVGRGHARVYTYQENPPPIIRTHDSFLTYARQAAEEDTIVKGVKGVSVCVRLPGIDMAKSFFPEPLHQAHLGAGRQILNAMCDTSNHRQPFYLSREKKVIFNTRMASIKPPDTIKRKPRSLDELPHWKGSEFHNFILFYSLECLDGLIPEEYVQHWMLFVIAMYFYSKTGVTDTELDLAHSFICHFCRHFERLYGVESCTYNIHNLVHFAETVREVAPFGEISAYVFEDANGILKHMKHGTSYTAEELANSIELLNAAHTLNYAIGEQAANQCTVSGCPVPLDSFPQNVIEFVENLLPHSDYVFFLRAVVRKCKYCAISYTRPKKSCCSFVQYENAAGGKDIGCILLFGQSKNDASDVQCVIQKVRCRPADFRHATFQYHVPFMFLYTLVDEFSVVKHEKIVQPVIKCINHLCIPPNSIQVNM